MVRHVRVLHVCAVEAEARGLPAGEERLITGVGPAAAGARLGRRLGVGPRVDLVFVAGVAGSLPTCDPGGPATGALDPTSPLAFPLDVGDVVVIRRTAVVDEGVVTTAGFVELRALGLPSAPPLRSHDRLRAALAGRVVAARADAATVSTGSGTDVAAVHTARRLTAAIHPDSILPAVETMESAALALACADADVPWIELRAISNRTGDRERGGWDLDAALVALARARALALDHLHTLAADTLSP
jgi:futalosine hydrolase